MASSDIRKQTCTLVFFWTILPLAASVLYPYNSSDNHRIKPSENNLHEVDIPPSVGKLYYHGQTFDKLFISKDGVIGFSKSVQYREVDWSGTFVSPFIDIPFIAPYIFEAYALNINPRYRGRVWYRTFTNTSTYSPTIGELRNYVRSAIVNSDTFNPTWGLEVTWAKVIDNDGVAEGACTIDTCKTGTFQVVLLIDGMTTYAIFNYGDMNIEYNEYYQAGFNGGNGTGWTHVHGDGSRQLEAGLTNRTFLFLISDDVMVRGGCNTGALTAYPKYANMFGGEMIDVMGPCLDNRRVNCSFGGTQSIAVRVSKSRLRCPVPMLTTRGRIILSLPAYGNSNYRTVFTIALPDRRVADDFVNVTASSTPDVFANSLTVSWQVARLTNDSSANVQICLYGYREDTKPTYQLLKVLGNANAGDGQYTFNTRDVNCQGPDCINFEVGVIQVQLKNQRKAATHFAVYSKPMSLGWFVKSAMESRYGSNWVHQKCVSWYNSDKQDVSWLKKLPSCPCSLNQALADFGRWQPDVSCSLFNTGDPSNCQYHNEAVHCVRSAQATSDGSGNQCCFKAGGDLLFSADSFQGSTPDRGHAWGALPYGANGHVPSLSHWVKDVVSFFYCCTWVNYGDCFYYMDQRPTKDCIDYKPPKIASVYGQSHIVPFGGSSYRIQRPGEYILFDSGSYVLQGKFEANPYQNTTSNNSFTLTAVAMKSSNTDKVLIRLRGIGYSGQSGKLDVRVNGQSINLIDKPMSYQDFTGISVINTATQKKNPQQNVTVLTRDGIGLQVARVNNVLHIFFNVPQTFSKRIIRGLFGDWNGNLVATNSAVVNLTTLNLTKQFMTFQQPWSNIRPSECLFQVCNNATGLPSIYKPIISQRIISTCGSNDDCKFDYVTTQSQAVATSTLQASRNYAVLRKHLQPVRSCGMLNVPRSTKSNYNYTVGTTTTVTGCRTGTLSGTTRYTCTATGNNTQQWMPAVSAVCAATQAEQADVGMIVGIVIAVIVVIALIVVAVFLFNKSRRRGMASDGRGEFEAADIKRRPEPDDDEPAKNEYTA